MDALEPVAPRGGTVFELPAIWHRPLTRYDACLYSLGFPLARCASHPSQHDAGIFLVPA